MRAAFTETRSAGASARAEQASYAAAAALAWRELYRQGQRNAALAQDVVAQLDLDPAVRSTHLALYVLSQQVLRRQALRARRQRLWSTLVRHATRRTCRTVHGWITSLGSMLAQAVARPAPPRDAPLSRESMWPNLGDASSAHLEAELLQAAPCRSAAAGSARRTEELGRRLGIARTLMLRDLQQQARNGPCISSPERLRDWLCLYCAGLEYEVMVVLFLDAQHQLISAEQMFRGSLTQTVVHPREIVKEVLRRNAAAVALAHNHPSAAPDPSPADRLVTERVRAALELIDVKLLDHFVIAGTTMVSMAQRGLL